MSFEFVSNEVPLQLDESDGSKVKTLRTDRFTGVVWFPGGTIEPAHHHTNGDMMYVLEGELHLTHIAENKAARISAPSYWITFNARLHNVEKISPVSDSRWGIKYKCGNCATITDKFVVVTRDVTVQNKTGRGEVNLDFSCKSCKRNSKVTIVYPPEDGEYPFLKANENEPKAILALSIHGGAEPVEVSIENSGPWICYIQKGKGKPKVEEIFFSEPNTEQKDQEQQSYDSDDDDYRGNAGKTFFRWYREDEGGDDYYRVDKIEVAIYTDRQLPDEQRPKGGPEVDEEEGEKAKSGKGGKGAKGKKK